MKHHITKLSFVDTISDVSSVRQTTSKGFQDRILFTCNWPIDRLAKEIKSELVVTKTNRVYQCELRPGPIPTDGIENSTCKSLIQSSISHTEQEIESKIEWNINEKQGMYRPHVVLSESSSFESVVSWINEFLIQYKRQYENIQEPNVTLYPSCAGTPDKVCFNCSENEGDLLVRAKVTESVDEYLLICGTCIEKMISYPFIYPELDITQLSYQTVLTGGIYGSVSPQI